MAENSTNDFPLTEDGSGYEREAVDSYLDQVAEHLEATEKAHKETIAKMESRTDMAQTTTILTTASAAAEAHIQEAKKQAEEIVAEARRDAEKRVREAEDKRTSLIREAERKAAETVAVADRTSRNKIADADRRAGNAIEEALTQVQDMVKSAKENLHQATERSKEMILTAERKHADAVAAAGYLTSEAEEYHKRLIAEADEYSEATRRAANETANSTRLTADRILNEAQAEAIRLRRDAEAEYDERMESINADLAAGRAALESFQNYYSDALGRLHDFYNNKISEVETLAQFRFPDGYDEDEAPVADAPTDAPAPVYFNVSELSGEEPPASLTVGEPGMGFTSADMQAVDLDDLLSDEVISLVAGGASSGKTFTSVDEEPSNNVDDDIIEFDESDDQK